MKRIGEFINTIKALPEKKALGKAISVSVLNQIVSSGTNFALGIYLVRVLPPEEFGLYGIGFAICLFFVGIGNALFLTQMVVHTPDRVPEDRLPYAARMLFSVAIFSALLLLIALLIFFVGREVSTVLERYANYGIAVSLAAATCLVKDFFVRHAYNQHRESWALAINLILAVSMGFLFVAIYFTKLGMSDVIALWIYAISNGIAALSGYIITKLPLNHIDSVELKKNLQEAWGGGSFSVLAHIIITLRSQAHTIVLAVLVGPTGVAVVNAGRIMVSPVAMLFPALSQIFLPRLSEARNTKSDGGRVDGLRYSLLLAAIVIVYSMMILTFYDVVQRLFIGSKYGDLFIIVMMWCIYTCLTAYKTGLEIFMLASKRFKEQAMVNFIGALVSLIVTFWLASMYGVSGAVAGLSISELVVILLMMNGNYLRKVRR